MNDYEIPLTDVIPAEEPDVSILNAVHLAAVHGDADLAAIVKSIDANARNWGYQHGLAQAKVLREAVKTLAEEMQNEIDADTASELWGHAGNFMVALNKAIDLVEKDGDAKVS
jgi:hypothetical protein